VPDTIDSLASKVKSYDNKGDFRLIREAYEYASTHHHNQYRFSGEDFISHPLEVAMTLADLQLDSITIAAALLHDVVEDTTSSLEDIRELFGEEIAAIIDGVTKLERINFESREAAQAETFRKLFVAMAEDTRVILIKLADRLHNMRTLYHLSEDKQRQKARETLDIYAPIAHRLGITQLRWQLEDLAFATLFPLRYQEIQQMVNQRRPEREAYIKEVADNLHKQLKSLKIDAEISGRVKHFYSIYNKMITSGLEFDEIYDLFAVRVITRNVKDCYAVLGVAHSLWKPLPGRFKDYIAMPKFNMYQSLHTTVVGPQGRPMEIQIRTQEMHRTAEYGIAAHWHYKETQRSRDQIKERLTWLKGILEWQSDLRDPKEFMEGLRIDLFQAEVFVFTPKGDVVTLPRDSTPIDFAYAIHTEVGHALVGAKVNDRIVSLEYQLQNGDIVQIITSKTSTGPSQDWLKIAVSPRARTKIRQWFSRDRKTEDTAEGKEMLQKALRKARLPLQKVFSGNLLEEVATADYNFLSAEDLLASIGAGKTSPVQVSTRIGARLLPEETEEPLPAKPIPPHKAPAFSRGVKVEEVENVLVRIARCCNPVPPDVIVGFVTRGSGVSVHRGDCPNALHMREQDYREIEVSWDTAQPTTFQVEIKVEAMDRPRLLRDITTVMGEFHVNIISATMTINREGLSISRFTFELGNIAHLEDILRNIRKIENVFNAYRVLPSK
jgi:guanosine-3',5'-bis(diphosphate) 3'-pyrophosphohydrolase